MFADLTVALNVSFAFMVMADRRVQLGVSYAKGKWFSDCRRGPSISSSYLLVISPLPIHSYCLYGLGVTNKSLFLPWVAAANAYGWRRWGSASTGEIWQEDRSLAALSCYAPKQLLSCCFWSLQNLSTRGFEIAQLYLRDLDRQHLHAVHV